MTKFATSSSIIHTKAYDTNAKTQNPNAGSYVAKYLISPTMLPGRGILLHSERPKRVVVRL